MTGAAVEATGGLAEPLGWLVLAAFLAGVALDVVGRRESARLTLVGAWLGFAAFWALLVAPWLLVDQSVVRAVGAAAAAPLSVLVARLLYRDQRDLFVLSRAIAFMGLFYAPIVVIDPLREWLILVVTGHTAVAMDLLGYSPPVVTELSELAARPEIDAGDTIPKPDAFENTFVFFPAEYTDVRITYTIIVACTGIGSMSVVAGLVAAVRAPLSRKLLAAGIALPIIYVLNIVRNVFIGLSYGNQYAHFFSDATMTLFGLDNPVRVSYIWADRIFAQLGSVVAMVLIIWLVVRIVPEVMEPIEDLLYLLTGEEYDLASALNLDADETTADPDAAD